MAQRLVLSLLAVLLLAPVAQAQNQTVTGSLTVSGDTTLSGALNVSGAADFNNNVTNFGTNGADATKPGLVLTYTDTVSGTISTITLATSGTSAIWQWERNSANGLIPQMTLTATNSLILWNPAVSNSAGIILNPNGDSTFSGSITATGTNSRLPNQQISTDTASIITKAYADNTYLTTSQAASSYIPIGATVLSVGYGTTATGANSIAVGEQSTASGESSAAFGYNTTASGIGSTAVGYGTSATGNYGSTAVGMYTTASGENSTATGCWSTASGDNSFTSGWGTVASGPSSVAMGGFGTSASADNSIAMGAGTSARAFGSTSMGCWTVADAYGATAGGISTIASGYNQFVIGRYNISQGDPNNWIQSDALFIIGNGTSNANRQNAFIVKKNGDATINGSATVTGSLTIGNGLTSSGAITLMGTGSSLFGNGSTNELPNQQITSTASILTKKLADDLYLPASTTNSPYLTTTAAATTYLTSTQAANSYISIGYGTSATGSYSTALGYNTIAAGSGQLVIGQYNSPLASEGDNGANWVSSDALLVVGNGTSDQSRSNALVVGKNGDLTIAGSAAVAKRLKVVGKASFSDVVTIPQAGDLSMGTFTNSGTTRAQTVAEAYFNTLASSSAGKILSDTEKENIISFLTGLDQIVGLDNVVECWTFRNSQNSGSGSVILGMLGKYNASIEGNVSWTSGGINLTSTSSIHVQTMNCNEFSDSSEIIVTNCLNQGGLSIFGSYTPGIRTPLIIAQESSIGTAISGINGAYSNEKNNGCNFIWASWFGSVAGPDWNNVVRLRTSLNGGNVFQFDQQNTYQIVDSERMSFNYLGGNFYGANQVASLRIRLGLGTLSQGQLENIYTLYKSTIGQGLGLP